MTTKFLSIALSALALSVLAALGFLVVQSPQGADINPSEVFTWDCEFPVQEPEAITFTCGDGGVYLDQIDWSRWDPEEATGTGIYNVNDCDPYCADGTILRMPVNITLTDLVEYQDAQYLRKLVIASKDGKDLPMMRSSSYVWDVMEFAEMVGNQ